MNEKPYFSSCPVLPWKLLLSYELFPLLEFIFFGGLQEYCPTKAR